MISREELLDLATDFGLAANVVEKDYALGWVLAALGQHPETRDKWLFKGGTCLKKCFFETYRFSEDLDFTLLDAAHLDEAFLAALFAAAGDHDMRSRLGEALAERATECPRAANHHGDLTVETKQFVEVLSGHGASKGEGGGGKAENT